MGCLQSKPTRFKDGPAEQRRLVTDVQDGVAAVNDAVGPRLRLVGRDIRDLKRHLCPPERARLGKPHLRSSPTLGGCPMNLCRAPLIMPVHGSCPA